MKTLYPWKHRPDWKMGASAGAKSTNSAAARGIAYHNRVYKLLQSRLHREADLLIEPWFVRVDDQPQRTWRQPDAVIREFLPGCAIVVEVKMNWADGRDDKLLNEYLPIVKNAFELDVVWPLLITRNLRGYKHPPLLGLGALDDCLAWSPGDPTPLLLLP